MPENRPQPDSPSVEVSVAFDDRSGPISGTVRDPDGHAASFHGWLELMDALELLRGGTGMAAPARNGAGASRT